MNMMVKEHRAEPRDEVSRILSTESLSTPPIDLPQFLKSDALEALLEPLRKPLPTIAASVAPIKPAPVVAAAPAPEPVAISTEAELTASAPEGDAADPVEPPQAEAVAVSAGETPMDVAEVAVATDVVGADEAAASETVRPHHEEMMRQLRESLARLDDSFVAQRKATEAPQASSEAPAEEPVAVEPLRNDPVRPTSPFPPATHRIQPPAARPATIFGLDPRSASTADAPPPPPVLKKPATPIMPPEAPAPVTRAAPPMRKPTLASLFRSGSAPSQKPSGESLHSYLAQKDRKAGAAEVDAPIIDPSAVIVAPVAERTFIPRPVSDPSRPAEGLEVQSVGSSYLGEMFERIRAQEAHEAAEIEASTDSDDVVAAVEEVAVVDPEAEADRAELHAVMPPAEAEEVADLDLLCDRDLEDALIGDHLEMPLPAPAMAQTGSTARWPIAAPSLLVLAAGNVAAIATLPGLATEIAYGSSALMTVIAAGLWATRKGNHKDDGDVA